MRGAPVRQREPRTNQKRTTQRTRESLIKEQREATKAATERHAETARLREILKELQLPTRQIAFILDTPTNQLPRNKAQTIQMFEDGRIPLGLPDSLLWTSACESLPNARTLYQQRFNSREKRLLVWERKASQYARIEKDLCDALQKQARSNPENMTSLNEEKEGVKVSLLLNAIGLPYDSIRRLEDVDGQCFLTCDMDTLCCDRNISDMIVRAELRSIQGMLQARIFPDKEHTDSCMLCYCTNLTFT